MGLIFFILIAGAWAVQRYLPTSAQQELEASQLSRLLGSTIPVPSETIDFVDRDGDFLADSPPDDECAAPQKLIFSYVASESAGDDAATWQPFLDTLSAETGLPTEFTHFQSVEEQLAALVTRDAMIGIAKVTSSSPGEGA